MNQKNNLLGILLLLVCNSLFAQESPVAAGGTASSTEGNLSYSVGQIVYSTNGNTTTEAQGVQQPFEISTVTGIENVAIELLLSVFPNPSTEVLTLKVEYFKINGLNYQLFDALGRLIENKKISDVLTTINTSNLVPAAYFLKVNDENRELKNFKIIKN